MGSGDNGSSALTIDSHLLKNGADPNEMEYRR